MNSNANNDNPLEYNMINNEIWEIDYYEGHAIEVSGYKRRESLEKNIIENSNGTIEDFLIKERGCRDIHFHNTMNLPRIHMRRYGKDTKTICTFRKNMSK